MNQVTGRRSFYLPCRRGKITGQPGCGRGGKSRGDAIGIELARRRAGNPEYPTGDSMERKREHAPRRNRGERDCRGGFSAFCDDNEKATDFGKKRKGKEETRPKIEAAVSAMVMGGGTRKGEKIRRTKKRGLISDRRRGDAC